MCYFTMAMQNEQLGQIITVKGFLTNGELGISQTLVPRDNSRNIFLAVIKEDIS